MYGNNIISGAVVPHTSKQKRHRPATSNRDLEAASLDEWL